MVFGLITIVRAESPRPPPYPRPMGTLTPRASGAFAQALNAHVEILPVVQQCIAEGIIYGIATARVAGLAALAIRQLSDADLAALVADVVANCEMQCDVPAYLNERFCPPMEALVIPAPTAPREMVLAIFG